MDISQVLILSTVEGLTEFLPISSTAHLVLTSHALAIPKDSFLSTFEISIQLGAIAAVGVISGKKILEDKKLMYKAIIGFVPTGIIGLGLYNVVKSFLSNPFIPVAALFTGGIAIILIEYYFKKQSKDHKHKLRTLANLTYKESLVIGLIQSISMIPGVSRSAASIFGGMILKLDRKSAVEFSFLLAIPTMVFATSYELFKSKLTYTSSEYMFLVIGIFGSFITALIAIRWLLKYVTANNFVVFGIYRIVLSIIYFFVFLR